MVEFQQYTLAFNLQLDAGNQVLDALARAERIVFIRSTKSNSRIPDFDPNDAAYWVDTVQPPITASLRSSLGILKSYNDALGGLANGETAEALAARFGKLSSDILGAGLAFSGAIAGPTAVTGAGDLLNDLKFKLDLLAPFLKVALVRAGREKFRNQLVQAAPKVSEFLIALRNATPKMFELMKRARVTPGSFDGVGGVSKASRKELERERALLAGWVLLMDKTYVAMDLAVGAASSKMSSIQTAAAVSEAAIELRIISEQVKSIRSRP